MPDFSSCVLDTSVVIKALFSPSHQHAGTTYAREVKTHKVCISLLSVLDVQGIEVFIPRCGLIEIAAVSSRLADQHAAEEICSEVETSFTLVPEERIIEPAKKIALEEGCPGFDTYFLAIAGQESIPLFTDDLGMHRICERRTIRSWLMRDFVPASVFPKTK
ncbi:type II toxin-antitoxin system VapC family toxin [Methanoregula sp.]|uniref:type II toxin-antitoxin system VapC family toxin n=1 Tax=Methanoregula sp. TaxID=2052170 RepID=UPI003C73EDF9